MTRQEQDTLNLSVAKAMGWEVGPSLTNAWRWFQGQTPKSDAWLSRESAERHVPRFCADPAAAELVRQEIERRGWDVFDYNEIHNGTRQYQCYIRRDAEEYLGTGDSANSPHEALCLAFLAAVDAQEDKP